MKQLSTEAFLKYKKVEQMQNIYANHGGYGHENNDQNRNELRGQFFMRWGCAHNSMCLWSEAGILEDD